MTVARNRSENRPARRAGRVEKWGSGKGAAAGRGVRSSECGVVGKRGRLRRSAGGGVRGAARLLAVAQPALLCTLSSTLVTGETIATGESRMTGGSEGAESAVRGRKRNAAAR